MNTIQSIAGNVQSNTESQVANAPVQMPVSESPAAQAQASDTQAPTYQAEQYASTAQDFIDQWHVTTGSTSSSDEYAAARDLIMTIDALKAAVVERLAALTQKAKDAEVIEKIKQQIAAGADPETLIATLAACRSAKTKAAAGTSKRSPHPKAPKVHENLAVPDHNDLKWGFTGSLRNLDSSKPGFEWAKKLPDGSADPAAFRKATDEEINEMQRRRDEYIKAAEANKAARDAG